MKILRRLLPLLSILCALPGPLQAQGRLEASVSTIELGTIEASVGAVPLSWTVKNAGDQELRLDRVDPLCPKTLAEPVKGILRPGESTAVIGTFDTRHFGGDYRGEVRLLADNGSSLMLAFHMQITPDLHLDSDTTTSIREIHPNNEAPALPLKFTSRSGRAIDPDEVEITGSPFIGANLRADGNQLLVTPYIQESLLPLQMKGEGFLQIHWNGCGSLDWQIRVNWERADPLIIKEISPKVFEVSYEDERAFRLQRLTLPPGLRYETQSIRNGRAMLFFPTKPRPKLKRDSKSSSFSGTNPVPGPSEKPKKPRPPRKPTPPGGHISKPITIPELLIQAKTTHPYRDDVLIDRRSKPTEIRR